MVIALSMTNVHASVAILTYFSRLGSILSISEKELAKKDPATARKMRCTLVRLLM
jgi:hypothetical protein